MLIRVHLSVLSLFLLIKVLRRRKDVFFLYIGLGALLMIILGLVSTVTSVLNHQGKYHYWIAPVGWLCLGYFVDVIFFSSAIGYRIKMEAKEKEQALVQLLAQQKATQQKEMEKIEAIFETREAERTRIATDLHDNIGAVISSVGMKIEVVRHLEKNKKNISSTLEDIEQQIQKVMTNLKDTIWFIIPENDKFEQMVARIVAYAEPICISKEIIFELHFENNILTDNLDVFEKRDLYLIAKEAINNALKYAKATKIEFIIKAEGQQLLMTINDNGIGIDNNTINGNGINNMYNRAKNINAHFSIKCDRGTSVNIKKAL
jgi:signal transduction histidine kinase